MCNILIYLWAVCLPSYIWKAADLSDQTPETAQYFGFSRNLFGWVHENYLVYAFFLIFYSNAWKADFAPFYLSDICLPVFESSTFTFPLSNRKTMATGPCWMNNSLVAPQLWKERDRARCLPPHRLLENRQQVANHARQRPVFLEQSNVPRPALREGRGAKRTLSLLLSRLESCCKSPRLSFAH